jgi:hypothetical protein
MYVIRRLFMTEQELRAKSLEIAVLILGERIDTKFQEDNPYTVAREIIDYHASLNHYIPLAEAIERYIREAGTA